MSPKNQAWRQKLAVQTDNGLADAEFSVLKLAKLMELSHAQLFRKLKLFTGKSPSQYIRERRLQQAKVLLITGQTYTVTATAKAVGLKDVAHFSKLFKERFGQSPSTLLGINHNDA